MRPLNGTINIDSALWSFEVKLLINRSNVRQCFFLSVSNSSWSNFSYLVDAEIEGLVKHTIRPKMPL